MNIDYIRTRAEKISDNCYRMAGLCDLRHANNRIIKDYPIERWYSQRFGDVRHVVYRFNLMALGIKYELHDLEFPVLHGTAGASLAYLANGRHFKNMTYNAACTMRDSAGFPNMHEREYRSRRADGLTRLLISHNQSQCLGDVPFYDEISDLYYYVPLEIFLSIEKLRTFIDEIEWNQYYDFFKGEYKLNIKKCTSTDIAVAIFDRKSKGRWCYRKKDNFGRYIY